MCPAAVPGSARLFKSGLANNAAGAHTAIIHRQLRDLVWSATGYQIEKLIYVVGF